MTPMTRATTVPHRDFLAIFIASSPDMTVDGSAAERGIAERAISRIRKFRSATRKNQRPSWLYGFSSNADCADAAGPRALRVEPAMDRASRRAAVERSRNGCAAPARWRAGLSPL